MYLTSRVDSKHKWLFWCGFLILALGEFYLFKKYIYRDVINFYPQGADQASYLPLIYLTYENIKQHGLMAGLWQTPSLPTGFLFPIQAVIFFLVFGASRFSVLLINFLYFIGLQATCLWLMRTLTNKTYFSLLFLGIFLTLVTPYLSAGGNLFDIRIDFMAFCLYGIFVCFAIRSAFFLDRKWTLVCAFLACFLILLRTLTLVYFSGIIFLVFSYLLIRRFQAVRGTLNYQEINRRLVNIILFCIAMGMVALPFIWLNREALYNYYMIGHVLGEEKNVRALVGGITDTWSILAYYPYMLLFSHFGKYALYLCGIFLAVSASVQWLAKKNAAETPSRLKSASESDKWGIGFVFLLSAIIIPLLALTLDLNKSPIVASIMVVPTLWLFFWYGLYVDSNISLTVAAKRLFTIAASAVLLFGIFVQTHYLHQYWSERKLQDLSAITTMYLDIGNYAVTKNWPQFTIAFDQLVDYLSSGGIATIYYESKGKLLNVNVATLGGTIFEVSQEEMLTSLKSANVVVVNLGTYSNYPPYPFNESLAKLKPVMKKYADKHFKKLGDYQFNDSTYRVYVAG